MSSLTAQAILHSWDIAQGEHAVRRSLALLQTAWPEVEPRSWGALPIGERDRWLLTLHDSLFGGELDVVVTCLACSVALDLRFSTAQLRLAPADDAAEAPVLRYDGFEVDFRLPGSDDLIEALGAAADDRDVALARLLERCVIEVRHGSEAAAVSDLPPAVIDLLQQEMARRDPGADTRVALECPACGHRFERRFDIGAYLWDEVDDWARRTLAEVHVLASAYGWSEAQILALSASRRRHYIGLVQG